LFIFRLVQKPFFFIHASKRNVFYVFAKDGLRCMPTRCTGLHSAEGVIGWKQRVALNVAVIGLTAPSGSGRWGGKRVHPPLMIAVVNGISLENKLI
jgi:hypothetical protein